ncbi:WS/DGAT domain-containing protein [Nocardia cyriacigeorgica]|uniref:WS/DGAT domain-containing protein n=1 Tax=Nocardia cyriacigeorgica TaxID=135487 RepID=UPI002455B861|nr:WS/DGAT domain-containing protein [Nocardia cyriacigeorgica]
MVPVDDTDPAALMGRVRALIRRQVEEPSIPHSAAVAAVLNRVPVALIAGMLEHVDFVASDVPGSPVPIYLAGARIDRMYAFSPTLGTAFNVTMTSHAGTCYVGINADTAAVPDVDTLTACLAEGFRTVLNLGGPRAAES